MSNTILNNIPLFKSTNTTMHLQNISIKKLHGSLNLDVNFLKDITLMVGINGSGKTSVLNCIDMLLRPNLKSLAVMEYEEIKLDISFREIIYTIKAEKTRKDVTLSLVGMEDSMPPIKIHLLSHIDPESDEAAEHYSSLGPEKHERPLWDFLIMLPRPIAITLDRTITAEADDSIFYDDNRARIVRRQRVKSPTSYVQDITSSTYSEYRKKAILADDELKAEIIMSALRNTDFTDNSTAGKSFSIPELEKLEERVINYLSKTFKSGNVESEVRSFFRSSLQIRRRIESSPGDSRFILEVFGSRFRQIESLAQAFNKYEKKNAVAFRKLRNYLNAVNQFFGDSGKELFFEESTGKLVFSFLHNGVRTEKKKDITNLSSGELQILILFTFLAFASSESTVFIIDEPELSLHPKWQHEFMDAFLKLKPPSAQVLIATHSPEIVGRHRHACVALSAKGGTQRG